MSMAPPPPPPILVFLLWIAPKISLMSDKEDAVEVVKLCDSLLQLIAEHRSDDFREWSDLELAVQQERALILARGEI